MAATHATTATDLLEALTHASVAAELDWRWLDSLLDQWLDLRQP